MNLQNDKDRDRSGPGFEKPENNLAKGSSETTRGVNVFNSNFENYKKAVQNYNKRTNGVKLPIADDNFLYWFIGFTEGDGSFPIKNPTKTYSKKNLVFTVSQRIQAPLNLIRENLAFGEVTNQVNVEGRTMSRYDVVRDDQIPIILALFNGNIILKHRHEGFTRWLNQYNLQFRPPQNPVASLKQQKFTLQNAWFSGFLQADGGFNISLRENSKTTLGYYLQFRCYITQKYERQVLQDIADAVRLEDQAKKLKRKLLVKPRKVSKKEDTWRIELISKEDIQTICQYLTNFPMKTEKQVVFLDWKELFVHNKKAILQVVNKDGSENSEGVANLRAKIKAIQEYQEAIDSDFGSSFSDIDLNSE